MYAARAARQLFGCLHNLAKGTPINATVQPGKEQILRDALLAMIEPTKKEPGCISYMLHGDPKNPAVFYLFEPL
jgi:quinol monooxygenase YgiN